MLSFDDFAKRLEALEKNVPKVFKAFANKGAIHFVNKAKDLTNQEGLVDTGEYKKNWYAEVIEPEKETYGIVCGNSMEYASFLEDGHAIKGGGRYKGRKVGTAAMNDTQAAIPLELDKEIDILFTMKAANVDRVTAKKLTGNTGKSMLDTRKSKE